MKGRVVLLQARVADSNKIVEPVRAYVTPYEDDSYSLSIDSNIYIKLFLHRSRYFFQMKTTPLHMVLTTFSVTLLTAEPDTNAISISICVNCGCS